MFLAQLLKKLDIQTEEIRELIQELNAKQLNYEPQTGKWSIRMHLAHMGRYHEVFRLRLTQIIEDDFPFFERYRSDWDAGFVDWKALTTSEIWERMGGVRSEIKKILEGLTSDQLIRKGNHPNLGAMDVLGWFEFLPYTRAIIFTPFFASSECGYGRENHNNINESHSHG